MCSRFVLKSPPKDIAGLFKLEKAVDWKPRYNIAPSQKIPAVIHPMESKKSEIRLLQWGFMASWTQGGRLVVNVQSESLNEKPLFQESFEKWCCLIPVDGFYHWRHEAKETKPYYIRMKNDKPFALAGIWAPQSFHGQNSEACAILTTVPNDVVRVTHDRMPVIIDPPNYHLWLDSDDVRDFKKIQKLFQPFPGEKMEAYEVDYWVNDTQHDDPRCIDPFQNPETIRMSF